MNLKLFNSLMKHRPSQNMPEWRTFLEICEMHLKKHKIKNPIVVELGMWKNRQKKFYEQLLGAHHISIDISDKRGMPDILGDTHKSATVEALKKKLNGRPINILFIDACHRYGAVKKDLELYSPLCSDIIAFHDIETHRHREKSKVTVWKFWDELKLEAFRGVEKYKEFLLLSIYQHRPARRLNKEATQMGIGVIMKR